MASVDKAVDMCVSKLGANGMGLEWYVKEHLSQALQVVEAGGSLFDLDHLVNLSEIMRFDVSYGMYEFIDQYYSAKDDTFSLFDIIEIPEKREEIKRLLDDYMEGSM